MHNIKIFDKIDRKILRFSENLFPISDKKRPTVDPDTKIEIEIKIKTEVEIKSKSKSKSKLNRN